MRARGVVAAVIGGVVAACGGVDPTGGTAATGRPGDVASVRLFDPRGTELTLHTGLVDEETLRVEVRTYAPDGRRLETISGGVELELLFRPESLATSAPVAGQSLRRDVVPTAASGTSGSQQVSLRFAGDGSMKSFGPFHVQVQPSAHGGVAQLRLFDAQNAEYTQHIPLFGTDTLRLEVRLYDPSGNRTTNVPGGVELAFRFEPPTLAAFVPVAQMPFWRDLAATSAAGSEGNLFVSVRFLADSVTKTYGPIQVLVH
jgi:hypothetical protein